MVAPRGSSKREDELIKQESLRLVKSLPKFYPCKNQRQGGSNVLCATCECKVAIVVPKYLGSRIISL